MKQRVSALLLLSLLALLTASGPVWASEIASADLQIQGVGLKVITINVSTGVNIPAVIQTEFGGKQNDEATVVEGLLAVGELSGPGIDSPIRLETAPGQKFQIPGLSREGVYFLQNIRLMNGADFLQPATPSVATITVSDLLQTSVRVKQLTPEDLRARGISIDARNYDVFEYVFTFLVNGVTVEIPFPVIVDPRTHEVREVPKENEYRLPPINQLLPPRWFPPNIEAFDLGPAGEELPGPSDEPPPKAAGARLSIPAAIVIPNNLAALHQFIAVTLMVTNGAPAGSTVVLDSVTAQIKTPAQLRTVKVIPSVAFNQPVPIVDATTGVTFLVAQSKGEAEWTLEGLQSGTHTLEVDVRATYKSPGQPDFPLKGSVRSSVVIHDPRFNVNFSHPDTVREGIEYSTFSFITNMSAVTQNIRVTNGVPACANSPGSNVCRVDGTPEVHDLSIPAGEMRSVEYKLRPGITGHVFATAGSVSDDSLTASVSLHMGVSESGIPLSPATLLMPYYSRFLAQPMISANLQLLGLGYSLATAPLTPALAKHPRIIKSDVFQRAVDIARAGQRFFLGEPMRDSLAHMSLDLLGNSMELREWDELRRAEKSGRTGSAAIAREIEASLGTASFDEFVSDFAKVTAWRAPYLMAFAHGNTVAGNARPYALSVRDTGSSAVLNIPSEASSGWVRQLPFAELNTLQGNGKVGELALVGRFGEEYAITVTPTSDGPFALDVIFPAATDGSVVRGHFDLTGASGQSLTLTVRRGATSLELRDASGGIAAMASPTTVLPEPIRILGARQDLNLNAGGHKVSVLWNRPVTIADGEDLLAKFSAEVILNRDTFNYRGPRPMSSAALQDGNRIANLTFDHALSTNASYALTVAPLVDPIGNVPVTFSGTVTPVIDNDRPGGIIFGHVLKGDNTAVPGSEVRLFLGDNAGPPQYDLARSPDGAFLFEFVPRDIDNKLNGTYTLEAVSPDLKKTSIEGAVRLPGVVHFVNLVFLGRGSAEGVVRYDNGEVVSEAKVVVGSVMFNQFRTTMTDTSGRYSIEDLPVGPLTFSAVDEDGNVTFAASEIKTPGQVLVQNLSIFRRPFPGTGTIRGVVLRSDTNTPVAFAQMSVFTQGYGFIDGFTESNGRFEFRKVPIGFVTVLAAEWSISREAVSFDFDLNANEVKDITMTIVVKPAEALVTVEGDVIREDPLHPGDANFYQRVPGAIVKIEKGQATTADTNGHYILTSVPVSFSTKKIEAYDPITTRSASLVLPQLHPGSNNVPIFIATADGYGKGTIRVKLLDAAGRPVSNYRLIEPGFPPIGPTTLEARANGVYELKDRAVGSTTTIWATGGGPQYGDQTAVGTAKVEFNGHVASLTMRLPGQGIVRTKLAGDIDVIGDVKITYPAWDEADQGLSPKDITKSTSENGVAGFATFTGVPAVLGYTVSSQHPIYGYATQSGKLGFDGDVQSIILQLNKLSTVRGVVYAIDGRTPVPGAAVRIEDGRQNQGTFQTLPDGSFVFFNIPAGVNYRVIADITQDGTYRTGVAAGTTPSLGGPVNNVAVVLRTQGGIDGRIVYAAFRVFNPLNPALNVPDDTPADLTDNAPVPLANFVLRELDYPYRSFGTTGDPLAADVAGRFTINNVFTGPLRVTASDPNNQETRGTWTGSISLEGERGTAIVGIGVEGFGPVVVRVVDPNAQNSPVLNAEVTLLKNSAPFDLSSTDGTGTVRFEQVPATGTFKVNAYSKALGKSGSSANFTVAPITGVTIEVILEFSGKVDGKLSDPDHGGTGVPGTPVTLTESGFQTRASTDVDGVFVFNGVREGSFKLEAKDPLSNRRAVATRELTQANPNPFVNLELEPTETLHLSVYYPNDTGGDSGLLVPLVSAEISQRNKDYFRILQGNPLQFTGVLRNERYSVAIKEIGGAARTINTTNTFPKGSAADPLRVVLPAFGSVEVRVVQGTLPAANAKVTVSGGSKSITGFTDTNGVAIASGIPLGDAYVQVRSVDNAFSGSASTTIASQSTPAVVPITLGAFAGVTGFVEAELGGPSVGTRVVATFASRVLEMLTDSSGRFIFQGIPTPSTVNLVYVGPDDVTVGARQTFPITNADASQVREVLPVKLDATPPLVSTIIPADGSNTVSPDSTMRITFTEAIQPGFINTSYIQLVPADATTPVATTYTSSPNADGSFTVNMTPPAAPIGQLFPLKSNTLYRIIISGEIKDLTGNRLPSTRGASFITSDYTEPRVQKVLPAVTTALQPATTFEFRFNEPIDPAPWQTGGGGVFRFYKLNAFGPSGAVVAEKPGQAFVTPGSPLSLFFSATDPIEQESFYRVVFSGVRDLQGNVLAEQTFHFFSYDLVKPFVILISPVPADFPLISGVEYTVSADVRNAVAGGSAATDIAKVDYLRVDGAVATYLFTATAPPWNYRFVGPDAPPAGSTLTLRAIATDLSFNEGDPADITWQVRPNQAPQNVAVALTPPTSIYPGNHAFTRVTFEDEGVFANVQVEAKATQTDDSVYTKSQVKSLTRTKVNDPWPTADLDFDLPATLKQGTRVTFDATVTDVRGLKGTASAGLDLTVDTIAPEILLTTPPSGTRYNLGQKFEITAVVRDLETGAAEVTFAFDNQTIRVVRPSTLVTSSGDHVWTFKSGQITVPAKNVDTTIPITITAKDYGNNAVSRTTEVIYVGLNDPTVPRGAWVCPIEKAVYPAGQSLSVKLQARANDDLAITAVKFTVPGITDPITATRVGTTDIYEATATINFPAVGETLTLTATVSDADPTHDIVLTIPVDVVAVDIAIENRIQAVTPAEAASYMNKSILVRGATARFIPHVPLTLTNLILLEGARVETLSTTTSTEQKLDLTVAGRIFIDCASSIDVSGRGYLGGFGLNDDGSGTRNNDLHGRTAGNTITGGATTLASASHGGMGGERLTAVTNAVYGSLTNPIDLGAGGGGTNTSNTGASGGGAVKLTADILAVAGAIRADGGTKPNDAGNAGAGGSINIHSSQFVTGPSARITANGGDDNGDANASRGAGGGRIAVEVTDRFELETTGLQIQARGGRNVTTTNTPNFLGGGAGTIFVRRPGQLLGELFVGSFDERFPTSVHLTRPTPLDGTLRFDRLIIGPRALVRADASLEIGGIVDDRAAASIDATAVLILNGEVPAISATTVPDAGGDLIQAGTLTVNYTATSAAGVGSVKLAFSPTTPDRVDAFNSYPTTATTPTPAVNVPATAPLGPATLTLSTTDRAVRSAAMAPLTFNVIANTAPVIDQFNVTPLSVYPGKVITSTITAHDDLKVTKLTLNRTIGTTSQTPSIFNFSSQTINQTINDTIPITTPGGQTYTLTLLIEDGFPGRTATSQTKTVDILRDTVAPVVTITSPLNNALFQEGTGNTISVRASILDADVGVKEAFVQLDNGALLPLTKSGNDYITTLPVPSVEGIETITKTLTVTGKDYEGNPGTQTITIRIQPLNDPNAPVVSWLCTTSGAMYPAGYTAKLRVFALGNSAGNPTNGITKVEMFVDDSTTPIPAALVSGMPNTYEAPYAIPAGAAAGSVISVRSVATNASNQTETATTSFSVVVAERTITANATIIASDLSYDNKIVVVQTGTTTILGNHTFNRLIVLDGAKVTHVPTDPTTIQRLSINATSGIFVSCTGSIDVTGLGFSGATAGFGRTWPNTTTGGSYNGAGGSHGGRGGAHDANGDSALEYGSVIDPNTPGGAGGYWSQNTCAPPCNAGGGIARVTAKDFVVDGKVLANGAATTTGTGAGGSIRIDAETLTGGGEIRADGAAPLHAAGGGGRVAVYYQTMTLDRTKITAAGGNYANTPVRTGTSGTVYLRQVDNSGAKVTDELLMDNRDGNASRSTPLAAIGKGSVTSVTGPVVTLSNPVPEWIEGSTIEFLDAASALVSSYEVASRTPTTVTVRLASGETAANVSAGNGYRGLWRFETVTARNRAVVDADAVRTSLITTGATSSVRLNDLRGDAVVLRGRVEVNGVLESNSLALQNAAVLAHSPTTASTINRLTVDVAGPMTVDATSSVDVTGLGFSGATGGFGRTWPNTTTGGSYNGAGGSHGGRGGAHDSNGDSALEYGSVVDPNTPGGAGGYWSQNTCSPCNAGGGVARITAQSLVLEGKILSNGAATTTGTGAGGSINIKADAFSGAGEIHADGASPLHAAGGGGRVAVRYQTMTFDRSRVTAAGGLYANTPVRTGTAGTIYFRQIDAAAAKVTDELVVDNLERISNRVTPLPALGKGTVTAVNGAVVTLSNPVPEWIEGATIEFLDGTGAVVSTYEVTARTSATVTVRLATGETAANAAVGNAYRGVWRFDNVTARGRATVQSDALQATLLTTTNTGIVRFGEVRGQDVTLRGRIEANDVAVNNLTLQNGATLLHPATTATTINRLNVRVTGTLTVDATSSIDVTGLGFTGATNGFGRTWPNTTTGGSHNGAGGSYGGRGGAHDTNGESAPVYGSAFDPNEPGGAGGFWSNGTCNPCNAGGGVARITAQTFVLDGKVLSSGAATSTGTGAGGAIRIDAQTLSGAGEIHADGAAPLHAAGGGGRVAVYYETLTLDRSRITAAGGLYANTPTRTGSAGTIYLKQTSQAGGDLVLDNLGRVTNRTTNLPGVGYATVTEFGSDFVKDANAQFPSLDVLRGIRVVVNHDRTRTWPILTNDNKTLRVDVSAQPLVAQVGQPIRGLYRLDNLKLRNTKLDTIDLLEVANAIDKDAPSTIAGNNQVPPVLVGTLVSLQPTPTGAAVIGSAGAATDSDTPMTALATNTVTGNVYSAAVNPDGSFAVPVQGNTGNAITLKVRDANVYPLESAVVAVGNLQSGTPVPSQVNKTDWTTDTNFFPRTLSRDGAQMAVASYPTNNGANDRLVILSVVDPAHPSLFRQLNTGAGPIRDVVVSNGWAYIAGDRLFTLNATVSDAPVNAASGDPCGRENAVVVSGGYAFTAEIECSHDGRLNIYDVSNPATPRYIRTEGVAGFGGIYFTDLLALGSDYIIGISPIKPGGVGHDVMVIDRRDLSDLKKVAELEVPNFDAFRGTIVGTTMYLVSTGFPKFVAVDLSNPAAPALLGSVTMPAPGAGAAVIGPDAFAAAGTAGLATFDISNPSAPVLTGTVPVGGNAHDVSVVGAYVYVANEIGIALVPATVAPSVALSRITLSLNGTMVSITGAPQSVTGNTPIKLQLTNTPNGSQISDLPVQSDGSFSATLPASPNDTITIRATDAFGRETFLVIGHVPFGSQSQFTPITTSMTDGGFLARNISSSGNYVAIASYPTDIGASDKIVLFDVTDRANPVFKKTFPSGIGTVRDLIVKGGFAYAVGDRLAVYDLSLATPTTVPPPIIATGDPCGRENALEIIGGYAFSAEIECSHDGRVNIWDISTPTQPRHLRTEGVAGFGGYFFTGLTAYGTDYLIGISPMKPGNVGHDVMVIDRRDINDLVKVAELEIPNFDGFSAKAVGTTLYVAGVQGGLAVVDLTNPSSPQLHGVISTPGYPRSVDAIGAMLGVADGSAGATFIDISPAGLPVILGNQPTGGTAWECAFNGATLYIANEQGLAVIHSLGTAPLIDRSLIAISTDGATSATVTGAPKAILGLAPITLEVRNTATGALISGIGVQPDGSFVVNIVASSGDALTIKATDSASRVSGPLGIGTVPFGVLTRNVTISTAMSDGNFLARNVGADGNHVVVGGYPDGNGNSDKLVIFDAPVAGAPVYRTTIASANGNVRDLVVKDGWAFVAGDRLTSYDLSLATPVPVQSAGDPCGRDNAIELAGGYAFTAEIECSHDGRLNIWDLSTPSAPRHIRTQGVAGFGGYFFTGLVNLGTDYIVGISPMKPGNVGHDVMVIDRRDINNLRKVSDIDIPNFDGFRGKAVGNMLYVAGVQGGVAIVDLSNPAQPFLRSIVASAGAARAIDVAGSTLAVANGSNGVSFIDVTAPSTPRVIGAHPVPGSAWDVALSRGAMYVASELGLTAVASVAVPPMLNESLLTVTPEATTTIVTGAAQALTGITPITTQILNSVTSATSPAVIVSSDGSFSATVAASPGQSLTLNATDVAGRVSTRSIGSTYGTTKTYLANPMAALNDTNYRSRRVASDGTVTAVTTGALFGTTFTPSNKVLLFRQPNASEAPQIVTGGIGGIRDVEVSSGHIYIAGDRLGRISLSDPNLATTTIGTDPCGREEALAISGRYAFTAEIECSHDGRVNIYDLENPATPTRSQGVAGFGGFIYRGLVPLGTNYLIGLSPDKPGGTGHDVIVMDITNITLLVKRADIDIPGFDALDGVVDGTTLYVVGGDGGMAIVDLSNPFAPQVRSVINTPGIARGIAISGPNEVVVADSGGPGLTFINVTDKSNPVIISSQNLIGNVVDVDVVGKGVYVGAENYFHTIMRP